MTEIKDDGSLAPLVPTGLGSPDLWSVGSWLSAALDDPSVCEAMKADVREWFDGGGHVRGTSEETRAESVSENRKNFSAATALPALLRSRGKNNSLHDIERAADKIEGLETDLSMAVQVAWRRGAKDWARRNYPGLVDWLESCDQTEGE